LREEKTKKEKERNLTVFTYAADVAGLKSHFVWGLLSRVVLNVKFHQNRLSKFGEVVVKI